MKKYISILMSIILISSAFNFTYADEKSYAPREYVISKFIQAAGRNNFENKNADITKFKDYEAIDFEYRKDIEIAIANNIVSGYEDATIKPDNNITRAEAAVILYGCIKGEGSSSQCKFNDVPNWAATAVAYLTDNNIISGYNDTTFGSRDYITAEQVGILVSRIDKKLNSNNPKDDFFKYTNSEFERNHSLSQGNVYDDLYEDINNTVDERINKIITNSTLYSDNDSKRITDVYNLYMDKEGRDSRGREEIKTYIDSIDSIKTIADIGGIEALLYKDLGLSPLFNFNITSDTDNSSVYIGQFSETNTVLIRDAYFSNSNIKKLYTDYAYNMADIDSNTADKLYNFEKTAIQKVDSLNYDNYGVVMDKNSLNSVAASFLENVNGGNRVLIYNNDQFQQLCAILKDENIDVIKAYYKLILLTYMADYLDSNTSAIYSNFYKSVYGSSTGTLEDRAVDFAKIYAGKAIVNKYAALYYDTEKENNIKTIINNIRNEYKTKLNNNTWLSDETKKAAIKKLDNINIKIGYEKVNLPYVSQINIVSVENGGTLIGNFISAQKLINSYNMSLVGSGVNKNVWIVSPFMVNACYVPSANEIYIPIAIMEAPFYSEYNSYYENLGGIGFIIAHEISHAFDPVGANYDEKGNMNDWWTEEDNNKFYDLVDKAIEYFNKYQVSSGMNNNGRNTVIENIADLSAVTCILDMAKGDSEIVKTLCEGFGKSMSSIADSHYDYYVIKEGSHSPESVRVNGSLSSADAFYDAYDINEGDGMYKKPEDRISIW